MRVATAIGFDPPQPDRDEILRMLDTLHPFNIFEVRALGGSGTQVGYFDEAHHEQAAQAIAQLNRQKLQVYATLNPVNPQLIARASNRMISLREKRAVGTQDKDIAHRHAFLIDCDPIRPAETSSSEEQLRAAHATVRQVVDWLSTQGWPAPLIAMSGNGYHAIYDCYLPNDEHTTALIRQLLEALSARFSSALVKIDRSVFNASRITKITGTVALKGDHSEQFPHRLARLLTVPATRVMVQREQIEQVIAELAMPVREEPTPAPRINGANREWRIPDVEACLARGGLEVARVDEVDGRTRWHLKHCPFNPEHTGSEVAVFLGSEGRIGFKCFHDSCSQYTWKDVRAFCDGPVEERKRKAHEEDEKFSATFFADYVGHSAPWRTAPKTGPTAPPLKAPIRVRSAIEVMADTHAARWVLRPYLEANAIILLFGDFSTYKSFIVTDWCCRIVTGLPAIGFKHVPTPAPVVLISAEGRGLWKRLRAWCCQNFPTRHWRDVFAQAPLLCVEHPVNLSDRHNVQALIAIIRERLGNLVPAAICVDTLSRNSDGEIENSTGDATSYLVNIDLLRHAFGCSIILPHHVGHAAKDRARGPIVLAANTDTLIKVERPAGTEFAAALTVERTKDSEPPPQQGIALTVVDLGELDEDGQPVTSLAVSGEDPIVAQAAGQAHQTELRGKAQRQLLAAIRAQDNCHRPFTLVELREIGRKAGMSKSSARYAVEGLTMSPYMVATVGGWRLADE